MNRPSFQFYPQDWRDDPALQRCSLEARGLWIEMMSLMHKGEPYGYLQFNSEEPVSIEELSQLVRSCDKTVTRALRELEMKGVLSKTDAKIIFSRRMIRDEMRRKKDRKRQKRHRLTEKKRSAHVTRDVTPLSRPSSSSSSSSLKDLSKEISADSKLHSKEERSEPGAMASPPPRHATVYWDPKPTWKPEHPSLKTAQLKVEPSHLDRLVEDYPNLDIRAEILGMKNHALDNPSWARVKRNWKKTLGAWIRREDEKLRDARFKARQIQASPAAELVAQEQSWQADDGDTKDSMAACEKEHGPHKDSELVNGSMTRYCKHECGYYVAKKVKKETE